MPDIIYYSSNMSVGDELQSLTDVQSVADASIAGLEVAAYIVLDRQIDSSLDPTASPATNAKYILTDVSSLHANFGTISGVGNNDIVNYTGSAWEIFFDASVRGAGSNSWVADEAIHYVYNATAWVTLESTIVSDNPGLENVLDIQVDATLDPGASPTEGDRYIIEDSTALHANFGSPTVSDDDILEYIDGAFVVDFDASAKGEGFGVWSDAGDTRYYFTGSAWVKKDVLDDHTRLMNIGTNTHTQIDTHIADADGHSNVTLNTTHRTSDGSDHSFIDQDVTSGASSTLDATNITGVDFPAMAGTDLGEAMEFIHGSFIDTPTIAVTSNGSTITLAIEKDGGGDIRVIFDQAVYTWDCTPADSVSLTAGSDNSPTLNYIYFDSATKTLTANTTGFPLVELALVAKVSCQSASSLQTEGAYSVHMHNDHLFATCGHLTHLNQWIRAQNATYIDGVAQTLNITTNGGGLDDVIFTSASGNVRQLHSHSFPAFSGTPDLYVVNDSSTAYDKITNLNTSLTDSTGASMSGRRFSLVVFGVVSEDSADCKLYLNLPSGSYNSNNAVISDESKYANYTIPADFKGTGFLIYEMKLRHQTAGSGTWSSVENVDLRGLQPSLSAGSGTSSSADFVDNEFKIENVSDSTKHIDFDASAITTGNTRTITMADEDIDLAWLGNAIGGQLAFPATQNPSADANTMDDYEEGTWTPTIQDNSSSDAEGQTYSKQYGFYLKTGDLVYIKGRVGLSSLGSMTTSDPSKLAGFPFTSDSNSNSQGAMVVSFASSLSITAGNSVSCYCNTGSTFGYIQIFDSTTGTSNLVLSKITASGDLIFAGSYTI